MMRWGVLVLFVVAALYAYAARPRPRKPARIAYSRLIRITALDRIRCHDARIIWFGEQR